MTARAEYRGVAGVGQGLGHIGVLLVKGIGEKMMAARGHMRAGVERIGRPGS